MSLLPRVTQAWVYNGCGDPDGPLNGLLRLEQKALPALKPGFALVRVDAAPVNPSDLMYIRGRYGVQPHAGSVPGFEGCGTVLAANAGPYGWWLKHRRVSFGSQDGNGSWVQYIVVPIWECIPVPNELPVTTAATLCVNPMTAIGLLDRVHRHRAKAFVMNAAGSALGRYVLALAQQRGPEMIGLVRRSQTAEALRQAGARHVLVSSEADFWHRLEQLCHQLRPTVLLDAVAGESTAELMRVMPDKSLAIVYGQLSQKQARGQVTFDPSDLVFRQQRVEGYWLTHELQGVNGIIRPLRRARQIIKAYQRNLFSTDFVQAVELEALVEAAEQGIPDVKLLFVQE